MSSPARITLASNLSAQELAGPGLEAGEILPLVEIALSARSEVRLAKLYDLSDQIRDGLAEAGVEVRDTADGQVWELITPE